MPADPSPKQAVHHRLWGDARLRAVAGKESMAATHDSLNVTRETHLRSVAGGGCIDGHRNRLQSGQLPLTSLLPAMNMGITINAARALGMADKTGSLAPGKRCDLAIRDVEHPAERVYRMGFNPLHACIWSGS
jgi:N-acetylglucosamine-6-phosphate deacetylase